MRGTGNWCRKTSRLGSHPLELLPKLNEHGDRRRIRRQLTDEELARLLVVPESRGRRAWYLTAALAGLRRSELIRLTWASVDLEGGVLTIRDGKAKREDLVPLHPELLEELKRIRPAGAQPADRVFPTEVTNLTRKRDFERAEIELVDDQGRVADLHGLRATLGTRLARAGVAPQVAQRLMRHADYRTTLQHYTRLSLANTVAAMKRLPGGGDGRASAGESAGGATAAGGVWRMIRGRNPMSLNPESPSSRGRTPVTSGTRAAIRTPGVAWPDSWVADGSSVPDQRPRVGPRRGTSLRISAKALSLVDRCTYPPPLPDGTLPHSLPGVALPRTHSPDRPDADAGDCGVHRGRRLREHRGEGGGRELR